MLRNKYIREFVTAYAPEAEELTADELEAIVLADNDVFGSGPTSLAASPAKVKGRSKSRVPTAQEVEEVVEVLAAGGIAYPKPSSSWRDGDKQGGGSYRPPPAEPQRMEPPRPVAQQRSQENPVYPAWWPAMSPPTPQPPAPAPPLANSTAAAPPTGYATAAPMWFVAPYPPPPPGTMPLYQFPTAYAPQYQQPQQYQPQQAPPVPEPEVLESREEKVVWDPSRATKASTARATDTAASKEEVKRRPKTAPKRCTPSTSAKLRVGCLKNPPKKEAPPPKPKPEPVRVAPRKMKHVQSKVKELMDADKRALLEKRKHKTLLHNAVLASNIKKEARHAQGERGNVLGIVNDFLDGDVMTALGSQADYRNAYYVKGAARDEEKYQETSREEVEEVRAPGRIAGGAARGGPATGPATAAHHEKGSAAEDRAYVNFLSSLDYDEEASLDTSTSSLQITSAPPTRFSARTEEDLQLDKLGFGPAGHKARDRSEIDVAMAWEVADRESQLSMSTSSSSGTPVKKPWMEDYGPTHTWHLKVGDRSTAGMDLALGDRGIKHFQHRSAPHADIAPQTARPNTGRDHFGYEAPTAYGRVAKDYEHTFGPDPTAYDPDVSDVDSQEQEVAWEIENGSASAADTSLDSRDVTYVDI